MQKSTHAVGIVLKRVDTGEADRIVTIFTREFGKVVAIAKGCRKLTSSRASALEPGVLSRCYLVYTKGMPILTQASILEDFSGAKTDLVRIRRVFEVLEMLDLLLLEDDRNPNIFDTALSIFTLLCEDTIDALDVRSYILDIVASLGFTDIKHNDTSVPLRDFVEEITQKRLHAYAYLTQGS